MKTMCCHVQKWNLIYNLISGTFSRNILSLPKYVTFIQRLPSWYYSSCNVIPNNNFHLFNTLYFTAVAQVISFGFST